MSKGSGGAGTGGRGGGGGKLSGTYVIDKFDSGAIRIGGASAMYTKPGYSPSYGAPKTMPKDITAFIASREKDLPSIKKDIEANARWKLTPNALEQAAYDRIGKEATAYYKRKYGK